MKTDRTSAKEVLRKHLSKSPEQYLKSNYRSVPVESSERQTKMAGTTEARCSYSFCNRPILTLPNPRRHDDQLEASARLV